MAASGFVRAWTSWRACSIAGPLPQPRGSWHSEWVAPVHGLRVQAAAMQRPTQRVQGGISGGMGPQRRYHGLAPSGFSAASRWQHGSS
jgi:hypothetical protein